MTKPNFDGFAFRKIAKCVFRCFGKWKIINVHARTSYNLHSIISDEKRYTFATRSKLDSGELS